MNSLFRATRFFFAVLWRPDYDGQRVTLARAWDFTRALREKGLLPP